MENPQHPLLHTITGRECLIPEPFLDDIQGENPHKKKYFTASFTEKLDNDD
ncbi:hypothetical protein [Membranihabitans marinus]|uniref:hypothetical protein n=1 Tax=Membranihabitans marinus TaxID=1227546 RepID=UPI001F29B88E|nr:hypothetical protein [Membranihabitans marinus]